MADYSLDKDFEVLDATNKFLKTILNRSIEYSRKLLREKREIKKINDEAIRWDRMKWLTKHFFLNLAKGNIVNFEILSFENDIFSAAEITQILEKIKNKRLSDGLETELEELGIEQSSESSPRSHSEDSGETKTENVTIDNIVFRRRNEEGKTEFVTKKILKYKGLSVILRMGKFEKLRAMYKNSAKYRNKIFFACAFRYQCISDNNYFLSIPPPVAKMMDFECFGSPFNCIKPCFTPFPEVDVYFGSKGNFFTDEIPKEYTLVSFNPPWDEKLMNMAINRLIFQIKTRDTPLTALCVIPVWDSETKNKYGFNRDSDDLSKDSETYRLFQASGLIQRSMVVPKDHLYFYDYISKVYTGSINIHIIVLSKGRPGIEINDVYQTWRIAQNLS